MEHQWLVMATVRLFARLREQLGVSEVQIELPSNVSLEQLIAALVVERGHTWSALSHEDIQCAVNQSMATAHDVTVTNADEIAFFPPMTGG